MLKKISIGVLAIAAISAYAVKDITSLSREELKPYADSYVVLDDGFTMSYREAGNPDGRTLLLIHGLSDQLTSWALWEKELASKYRIISIDLPGHGLTDQEPDHFYTRDRFAEYVKKFTDKLGLKGFVIGGNSYGGGTSAQYVINNPEDVKALILVDAGGYLDEDYKDGETVKQEEEMAEFAKSFMGKMLEFQAPGVIPEEGEESGYMKVTSHLTLEMDEKYQAKARFVQNRDTIRNYLINAGERYKPITRLNEIKVPTLILWGEQDEVAPVEHGYRFKKDIADSELIVYKDIAHMPQLENPVQSARDVDKFLTKKSLDR